MWSITGEELATTSPEEIKDSKSLRHHLCKLHGYPMCIQRLLHEGCSLSDSMKLDGGMEIQLVLVSISTPEQHREATAELVACASWPGGMETARLLLNAGVDSDMCDEDGNTALARAAETGHARMVRLLLEAGANKDLANRYDNTPLMCAVAGGHVEIVHALLDADADKHAQDLFGDTPLICAAQGRHVEIVRLLLAAGVHKDQQGHEDATALSIAAENNDVEIGLLSRTCRMLGACMQRLA